MAFQSIPCSSTNPQLQVPLQDSQRCFVWNKVFCETDAQPTLEFISFHRLLAHIFSDKTWNMPSLMTFFLAYVSGISSDILSGILSGISSEILCGWGPARNTLIRSSRLRSGTLWSGACGGGPAGTLRSGGERFDPEVAVWVRRGTLRSRACSWGQAVPVRSGARCWGPAVPTEIWS